MVFGFDNEQQAQNYANAEERWEDRTAIQAIRESWELSPEQRHNAIQRIYGIVVNDETTPKMVVSAFNALIAAERQNLQVRLSHDQTQRMMAAIQARIRWGQQLPNETHPLILEQDGSQSRSTESVDDVAAAVIEKINLIEAARGAAGAGGVQGENGNGDSRAD